MKPLVDMYLMKRIVNIFIFFITPSAGLTTLSCITPYEIIDLDIDAVSNSFQYTTIGTSNISPSCAWLFQSSDPTMTIFVSNVNIDCTIARVAFFDGPSANASSIEGAVCCPNCTGAAAVNQLYVNYTKEATSATVIDFQITVLIGKDESRCSNGFGNYVQLTNDVTLTSPNFPSLYPINFVCYYSYTHFGGRIKVTFSYLDLEVDYDYVEINDGNSTLKLQGTTIPQKPFLSEGQKITLMFYSDTSIQMHGFKALISPFYNIITEPTTSLVQSSDKTIKEQSPSISSAFIVANAFAAGAFCFSFFIVLFVIFKMKRHSSENRNVPNACYEGPSSATKPDDYEIPVTRHHVENVYDENSARRY
ncbi:uncharacterized protein LOC111112234 isoform X1 [Crassostrea virginica]